VLLFKPLQWLGSISFEVYVLQFAAFHLFNYLLSPLAGHFGWLIYDKLAWLSLLLLVPLAWAVNRLFTRPLRKMINAKFKTT
jgi:peptidoglycan/LPS O-acetylase OafA/YrhL